MKRLFGKVKKFFAALLLSTVFVGAGFAQTQEKPSKDPHTVYPERYGDDYPTQTTFSTQFETQVPEDLKPLWQDLQYLRNSNTIIGPAVVKFADDNYVFYTYEPMWGVYGYWQDTRGIVRINSSEELPRDFMRMTVVHETIHGIQTSQGVVGSFSQTLSISDIQKTILSYEAAAKTGGYLIALELMQKGDSATWKLAAEEDPARLSKVMDAWNRACLDSTSYSDALTRTGTQVFRQQFNEQWWLSAYTENMLHFYVWSITARQCQPIVSDSLGVLNNIRMSGYISPEFNFTASENGLPSELFGENVKLRQAFAYADLYRIKVTSGEDSRLYRTVLRQLEKDQNPYIGVNLDDVFMRYRQTSGWVPLVAIMDSFAQDLAHKKKLPRVSFGPAYQP